MGSIAAAASAPASDVVRADPRQLKKAAPEPRELLAVEVWAGIHASNAPPGACTCAPLFSALQWTLASTELRQRCIKYKRSSLTTHTPLCAQERSGTIHVADTQLPIISQLSHHAFVSDRQQHGLVLGFRSAEGAKSMVDTAIGKVRLQWTGRGCCNVVCWVTGMQCCGPRHAGCHGVQ